jgi:hypothetical protein
MPVSTPLARLTAALLALVATACAAENARQVATADAPAGAAVAPAGDSLRSDSAGRARQRRRRRRHARRRRA